MIKTLLRYGSISMMLAGTTAGLAGAASADASIGVTGPDSRNVITMSSDNRTDLRNFNDVGVGNFNNQSAVSGSVTAGGNTELGGGPGVGAGWGSWDPVSCRQTMGFGQWWSGVNGSMSRYSQGWTGGNSTWMPTGAGWQNTWMNWDPMMWRQNGASYAQWLGQITPYMNAHYNDWMNGWGNSVGGSVMSGAATNSNSTGTGVTIGGRGAADMIMPLASGGNGDASIAVTGPGSTNVIAENSGSSFRSTNVNEVGVTNSNDQSARSGNVDVSRNTVVGGGVSSGAASNSNSTGTEVNVSNPAVTGVATGGSGTNGSASIDTTGPGSTNRISENNRTSFTSTNVNEVAVTNSNNQTARSGNVDVSRNTVVSGDISSGDARNSNGTSTGVGIN
ncbi:MAG TPA: hypothetical protein VHQ86_01215 [Candidatus Saccharimonadia bacterium]|jgi:hypothetical protein|nr:hypothetical protein [Candidatus Saccharimonadia bacterium]